MSLNHTLASTGSLWTAFLLTILVTASFPPVADAWKLTLLDAMSDPEQVRATIAALSAEQRTAHAWITGTLDVLYPLVYGALFIGSAYAFYGSYGRLVALPYYVLVATDLLEGIVQILALNGVADWVDAKAVLTPLKTGLFLLGVLTTVIGWISWLWKRIRRRAA